MNHVAKKPKARSYYRVRWVALDGTHEKGGFTTRLAAIEWSDKNVVAKGFSKPSIEHYAGAR